MEYVTWTENGKEYTQISAIEKRRIIAGYVDRFPDCHTFIETGTCEGDTIDFFRERFTHICSFEVDEKNFYYAANRFKFWKNIHILCADSGLQLASVFDIVSKPVLFWLDAHGPNWVGPIVKELEAIFASGIKGVILIDDMDYITDTLPTHPDWKEESREYGIVRLINVG